MKRLLKTLVWPIILAPLAYLWISWKNIPSVVPMHYNLRGEVDRYGSRNELLWLVIILTSVNLLTYLLLTNLHRFDPKRPTASNRERMPRLAFGVSIFLSVITAIMIYYSSHPELKLSANLILIVMGLLFAFLGNYMHSIKPNYFAGFRLPWTLENEDNWRLTHALGGKLWFAGGILITILALLAPSQIALIGMIMIMAVIVLIPAIYSYRLYKKQRAEQ